MDNMLEDISKEDGAGMLSYSFHEKLKDIGETSVNPRKISYGDAVFKNFGFREVFEDGKNIGEYYIKINNPSVTSIASAHFFFTSKFENKNCDTGIIDIDNTLGLNYHIYIKTENEMVKDSICSYMDDLDKFITKNLNNRIWL